MNTIRLARRGFCFLIIGFLIGYPNSFGQTVDALLSVGPTPEAAALAKVEEVPVGLHTGTPSVSVPLYTVRGRQLSLPITLSHHGAAIRVDEVASWVGLGWSLNAGGVITRSVRGIPDDDRYGYLSTGDDLMAAYGSDGITQGELDSPLPIHVLDPGTQVSPGDNNRFDDIIQGGRIDPEPDRFFFNFAGRSGQFMVGPSSGSTPSGANTDIVPIPLQDIKIDFESTSGPADVYDTESRQHIASWTITTEDGTQYIFTDLEWTEQVHLGATWERKVVSSWYLTRIKAANGEDTIDLHYEAKTPRDYVVRRRAFQEKIKTLAGSGIIDPGPEYHVTQTTHKKRWLSRIVSAHDEVLFYANTLRADALDPRESNASEARQLFQLDKIEVQARNGALKRRFDFSYSYFSGSGTGNSFSSQDPHEDGKRLRLDKVQEYGADSAQLPPYLFTYAPGSLPSRHTRAVDYWGFYNGKTTNSTLVPRTTYSYNGTTGVIDGGSREPTTNLDHLLPGTLEQVVYPTGGTLALEYELRDYGNIAQPVGSGSTPTQIQDREVEVHLYAETSESFTGEKTKTSDPLTIGGDRVPVVATLSLSGTTPEQLAAPDYCAGSGPAPWCATVGLYDTSGNPALDINGNPTPEVRSSDQDLEQTFLLDINQTYVVKVAIHEDCADVMAAAGGGPACVINGKLNWEEEHEVTARYAAGIRIKRTVLSDAVDASRDMVRTYRYLKESGESSGTLVTVPQHMYIARATAPLGGGPLASDFVSVSGSSYVPLGSTQGSSIGYDRVVVEYGTLANSTQFGYEEHRFTPPEPEPLPSSWVHAGIQDNRTWKYGLPLGVNLYDASQIKQHGQATTYHFSDDVPEDLGRFRRRVGLLLRTVRVDNGIGADPLTQITAAFYAWYGIASSFAYPKQHTITTYDALGNTSIVQTAREFQSNQHLQPTAEVVTNTDGTQRRTEYEYAFVAQDTGMKDANLIAPIYQTTISERPSGPGSWTPLARQWSVWRKDGLYWRLDKEAAWTDGATAPSGPDESGAQTLSHYLAYDDYGNIKKQADALGNETDFSYDGLGKYLTGVTAGNLSVEYSYYNSGHKTGLVESVTDPNNKTTTYNYDGLGRLRTVTGPTGLEATYTYAVGSTACVSGAPTNPCNYVKTSAAGGVTEDIETYTYVDGLGRPMRSLVADIYTDTEYDARGRVFRTHKPDYISGTSYHASTFGPNAEAYTETTYLPDPTGRIASVMPPHVDTPPNPIRTEYPVEGGLVCTKTFDEDNKTSKSCQDGFGNTVLTQAGVGTADEATTQFVYNALGQLQQVTSPKGYVTAYQYDRIGRLIAKTTPDADGDDDADPSEESLATPDFAYIYDRNGNLRFSQDPNQRNAKDENQDLEPKVAFTTYDALNRPVVSGEGIEHNFAGLDPHAAQGEGVETEQDNWIQVNAYDRAPTAEDGFPWAIFVADAPTLRNTNGRLAATAFRTKLGGTALKTLLVLENYFLNTSLSDDCIRAIERIEARNVSFSGAAEACLQAGQEIRLRPPFQASGQSTSISINSQLQTANALDWVITAYSYDERGRVETLHQYFSLLDHIEVKYSYDNHGNVTLVSYQGGKGDAFYTWYDYDNVGRLERVTTNTERNRSTAAGAVVEAEYEYLPTGQVATMYRGNDGRDVDPIAPPVTYTYHIRDWVKTINTLESSITPSAPFAMELFYDDAPPNGLSRNNGNISGMMWATQADGTGERYAVDPGGYLFRYDDLNRLISGSFYKDTTATVALWGNADDTHKLHHVAYDKNGNIDRLRRGSQADITYAYTSGSNRLAVVSGGVSASYTYDANGNVLAGRGVADTEYDHRNLPTEMQVSFNGTKLYMRYDAAGQRLYKRISDGDTDYTDDVAFYYVRGVDGSVLAVYDKDCKLLYWNVLAGGRPIGRVEPPVVQDL